MKDASTRERRASVSRIKVKYTRLIAAIEAAAARLPSPHEPYFGACTNPADRGENLAGLPIDIQRDARQAYKLSRRVADYCSGRSLQLREDRRKRSDAVRAIIGRLHEERDAVCLSATVAAMNADELAVVRGCGGFQLKWLDKALADVGIKPAEIWKLVPKL